MTPLGRIAQPSDIAPIAVFLASDEASWLTGEIILAFGGRVRHPRLAALPGPQQLGPKNESAGVASGSRRLT
jgi:Enoyl-(Acyl carrier protein) reductase